MGSGNTDVSFSGPVDDNVVPASAVVNCPEVTCPNWDGAVVSGAVGGC